MKPRLMGGSSALAGLLLTGLAVSSCSAPPTIADASTTAASGSIGSGGAIGVDTDPVTNTSQMLEWSDLVATGTIVAFTDGVITHENGVIYKPVIAKLDNVEVTAGSLPKGSDGFVYMTMVAPTGAKAVAKSIPLGTKVIVYGVNQNAPKHAKGSKLVAGMPSDQPMYAPVHPAGFALELTRDAKPVLVWPMAGAVKAGGTIDDVLPGNAISLAVDEGAYADAVSGSR